MGKHAFTDIAPAPKIFAGHDLDRPQWNGVRGPNARIDMWLLDDEARHRVEAVELQLTIAQAETLIRDIRSEIADMREEGK